MHSKVDVLLDSVIETIWFPRICEKYEGDRLTKIIKLKSASPNGVHD